tara:strand:- start:54 stop:479 length:426 start_codon:yes stop_codon:yes gene_type:complete
MISQAIFNAGVDVLKAYDVKWTRFDAASIKTLYKSIIFEGELPDEKEFNSLLAIQFEKYFMEELRVERNKRLTDCDWTQNKDVVMNDDDVKVWNDYRKKLRDLPSNVELKDGVDMEALFPEGPKQSIISPVVIPVKEEGEK